MTVTKDYIFGNNAFEESMLKGILAFNEAKQNSSRGDMILKALYSLIIESEQPISIKDIMKTVNKRFSLSWSEEDTFNKIKKIEKLGLVNISKEGTVKAIEEKDGKTLTKDIIEKTGLLISKIENKLTKAYRDNIPDGINNKLKNVIKNALSMYFRHSGLEFVGLKRDANIEETENAIDCIKEQLKGSPKIAELLVRVLAETLHNPEKEDRLVLEKWARAYIAMQVIGLDPVLANFKESKLRGKSFVFDTDVVLNCITKNALNSKDYCIMLEKLKSIGCKLYIPPFVIEEAEGHCKFARVQLSGFEIEQVLNFSDEILEQEIGNVFVEDYVKTLRQNPDMQDYPFDVYLDNFYERDNPNLFYNNISQVFGKKNIENKLPDLNDGEKKIIELKNSILAKTELSRKGGQRKKEVNEELSEADAVLYLTLCQMNQECDDGDFFANKAYLLTGTKKGVRSAKELGQYKKNIICHPRALLSILIENGLVHTGDVNLINLMDNPFLVYTAEQIWTDVEPLIKAGAKLKYAELNRLRVDVDTKIDKILTCKTPEERYAESKRLANNGYFFGQDIIDATEKAQALETTINEQRKSIAQRDKEIEELKAERDKLSKEKEELKKQSAKNKYEERIKLKKKKK